MPSEDWKAWAVPWNCVLTVRRVRRCAIALDLRNDIAQGDALGEVEGKRHGRKLAEVLDGERADLRLETARRRSSGTRCPGVTSGRRGGKGRRHSRLKSVIGFEDHPVLIGRRVDGGDLTRAVGIAQSALDLGGADAEAGGLVAVDIDQRPAGW